MKFYLKADFSPSGDQPQAIRKLVWGLKHNLRHQVLLGVTGSGKTFTIANLIEKIQQPVLVISHNKTLAAQLYQEFRDFFPNNAVSYFVSYYDFYQPEAYIPSTDTYIEKEAEINDEIDKLRLSATANLLTRKDTIIVASVSCIYNLGSPNDYANLNLSLKKNLKIYREALLSKLVTLQYQRSNLEFKRGYFRVKGEIIDVFPAYSDDPVRIILTDDKINQLYEFDYFNGKVKQKLKQYLLYPAKHYLSPNIKVKSILDEIRSDLDKRVKELEKDGRKTEAYRLIKRVNYDLEMIEEIGYVNGIENYSRYFDGRKPGEPPYTLIDYFHYKYNNDWLLIIDESHMTIPQIKGMYNGDFSRKKNLIDFGFRLPAALDNRPLNFYEFLQRVPRVIYVSATPDNFEISLAKQEAKKCHCKHQHEAVIEQLIRPTGIVDPEILIRPTKGQVFDLIKEIIKRKKKKERVLVTTLTKKIAEDLSNYLNEKKYIKKIAKDDLVISDMPVVRYLHSDIETLKRSDILDDLRLGKYDVIVGINLLREGLDLPEVSLVAILDADKEGFLRSETSLIQTMGRAARHVDSLVIMYADQLTNSIQKACLEIQRRRKIQLEYNQRHRIIPKSISKPIRNKLVASEDKDNLSIFTIDNEKNKIYQNLFNFDINQLTPQDKKILLKKLSKEMVEAAKRLDFELAAHLRDKIKEINNYAR